jgi:GNAT superfamily N-acetyltransferase
MVSYSESTVDLSERDLRGGFFEGWAAPPDPDQHLRLLVNSAHVVVARDDSGAVIGFVNALSDGVLSAYVPLLEVLPAHRGKGVGTELVRRLMGTLVDLYMVDVMCDAEIQPFYERLGFVASSGAIRRNYKWRIGTSG